MLAIIPLIVIAIIALSILVMVHELGHFLVAKKAGVWVEEFGLGIPPRLFGKKIGETIYSINALPFGGFVRLHGETTDENVTNPKKAFLNKSKKVKIAVAMAGVVMNIIFAIFAYTAINFVSGVPRETQEVRIVNIAENSPASEAGLNINDIILSADSSLFTTTESFTDYISQNTGEELNLLIQRDSEFKEIIITPRENPPEDQGALGVVVSSAQMVKPPLLERPFVYLWEAIKQTWLMVKLMIIGFASIFGTISQGEAPQGVAGPLGITALLIEIAKLGFLPLLEFMAIISVNLALLNMIPFPPLDGSRVFFVLVESVLKKKVKQKTENLIYTAGMALLIGLLILVTAREIPALLSANSLSGFVDSILQ